MSDQQQIIKLLCASLYSKLSLKIGDKHQPASVATFCSNLFKLLKSDSYQKHLSISPIIIALDVDSAGSGSNIFASNLIDEFYSKGQVKSGNILYIDISGKEIIPKPYDDKIVYTTADLNDEFPDSNFIFFFIEGNSIEVIEKCRTFKCIPDIFSLNKSRAFINRLPISEYRTLINNHYSSEIIGQRRFEYWENKGKRVLVASPEVNFRKQLGAYLDLYVADGIVDQECLNASTDDRTDIRISTCIDKDIYIIEVKWIGKCATHSNYDGIGAHRRANEGIQQIEVYLATETRCIKALLVVYDSRIKAEPIIWNPDKNVWHKVIDRDPFIIYLDSVSASVKGKELVKSSKTKKSG
jgi:hypothetical protein